MRAHVHRIFNPTLIEIYDFMTPEECAQMIEDIKQFGTLKDAEVVDRKQVMTQLVKYIKTQGQTVTAFCLIRKV